MDLADFDWTSVDREQLDLLLESVEATIWAVDRDLRFRFSRGVVPRRGGLTHAQMVGLRLDERDE